MPEKNPAIVGYGKAIEKLSNIDISGIVFLLFFIVFITIIILLLNVLAKSIKAKAQWNEFVKYSKERELNDKMIQIIWQYSKKMGRDPFLALEFKSPFEKVIDLYIKENPDFDENLIKEMREKLGFDYVPSFIPITTTKDIELFQGETIKTEDGRNYRASLYDKDEMYMYWVITDKITPNIKPGDKIKIIFTRKSDASYIIESKVEDVKNEGGNVILKVLHTFEITRIQRREHPRVDIDLEAIIGKKYIENNQEITKWIIGRVYDISASGTRFCIDSEQKENVNLRIGDEVFITFSLNEKDFQLKGEIVNIYEKQKTVCYGIKFLDIKESQQKEIFDFVKKEQQKLLSIYKKQS